MRRIDLPDGQWAELRDVGDITTSGKRGIAVIASKLSVPMGKIVAAMKAKKKVSDEDLGLTEWETDAFMRMSEATIVALLLAWSYPDPLPTLATVGDMPASRYDALMAVTAKDSADLSGLTVDMSVGDGTPDPKDHSGASKNSGGRSRVAKAPTQTRTSPTGSRHTGGGS